jgi:hypothetical protein
MSDVQTITDLVDQYAREDAKEKLAAETKKELRKKLLALGCDKIEGTYAKLSITNSEKLTLDPEAVRAVVSNAQFLTLVNVSNEKFRTLLEVIYPEDAVGTKETSAEKIFKSCVSKITKVQTITIKPNF